MGAITLLLVFLLVLLLNIFQHYSSPFVSWLTKRVFYDSEKMTLLKDELKEVTEEQAALDMKEEFPKYARLGRKKTKIQDQLKSFRQSKTKESLTFSWGLTLLFNILHTVCLISLIVRYRYVELINLNPEWFWPISSLLAFPTGMPGAVGITCWVILCNVVLGRLVQAKNVWNSSNPIKT